MSKRRRASSDDSTGHRQVIMATLRVYARYAETGEFGPVTPPSG